MFEYKIVYIEASSSKENVEEELNKYGSEGWELVSAEAVSKAGLTQMVYQAGITSGLMTIFKRRKDK